MYYAWEKYKKRKGKLNIYTSQTNAQLHTYKQNKPQYLLFYLHEKKSKIK